MPPTNLHFSWNARKQRVQVRTSPCWFGLAIRFEFCSSSLSSYMRSRAKERLYQASRQPALSRPHRFNTKSERNETGAQQCRAGLTTKSTHAGLFERMHAAHTHESARWKIGSQPNAVLMKLQHPKQPTTTTETETPPFTSAPGIPDAPTLHCLHQLAAACCALRNAADIGGTRYTRYSKPTGSDIYGAPVENNLATPPSP